MCNDCMIKLTNALSRLWRMNFMRRRASPLFHRVPSRPPPVPAAPVFFSIASIKGPIFKLAKHDILSLFFMNYVCMYFDKSNNNDFDLVVSGYGTQCGVFY